MWAVALRWATSPSYKQDSKSASTPPPQRRFQDVTPYRLINRPKRCHGLFLRQFESHHEGTMIGRNVGNGFTMQYEVMPKQIGILEIQKPAKGASLTALHCSIAELSLLAAGTNSFHVIAHVKFLNRPLLVSYAVNWQQKERHLSSI